MNYRMTLLENNIARFNTSISRTKTSCSILSKEKMLKGAGAYTTFGIKGEVDVYLPLILQNYPVSHTGKTSVDARAIWGTNFHELAHILYSEHTKNSLYGIVRKYDPMILEENRVEFLYFCEFPGTEQWLEYGVLKATNNFNISEEIYRSNDLESVLQMYMLFSARTWIRDIHERLRNNLIRLWGEDNVQELDRLILEFCTLRKSEIGNAKCRKIMLDIESLLPDNLYSSPTPPCPLGHNANNTPSSDYDDNTASNIAKSKTNPDDNKDDNEEDSDAEDDQNDSSENNDEKEYGGDGSENSDISEEDHKNGKSSSRENHEYEDDLGQEDSDNEDNACSGKEIDGDDSGEEDNPEDSAVNTSKGNNDDSEEFNDEENSNDMNNDSSDPENSDDKQSFNEENRNSSKSYGEDNEEPYSEEQGDTLDNQEKGESENNNIKNHELDPQDSQSSNNPLGIDEGFMDKQQRDADMDVKNSDSVQYSNYSYFNDTPAMLNISVSQDIVNKKRIMERELESINDEAQSGYLYGLPSGSVNMNVAFSPYRDIDRMFYEWSPGVEDAVSIELVVLVDCSGSMDGRTQKVMESVYPIISAFYDFEGISNINVFAFNESSHTIYNDKQTISPIQVSYPESVGGTDPSQSLYKAVDIFKNSLIERKIMLVFTDGAWNRDFGHYNKILNTIKSYNVSTGYMMYGDNNDTYKMFDYYVNSNDINDFGKMANTIVMESMKNDIYIFSFS